MEVEPFDKSGGRYATDTRSGLKSESGDDHYAEKRTNVPKLPKKRITENKNSSITKPLPETPISSILFAELLPIRFLLKHTFTSSIWPVPP